ncbi:MAG: M48 family metalloprotease [Planctomycetota bacterium]
MSDRKIDRAEVREAMLEAVARPLPRKRPTAAYRLGIAGVAAVMVMLPTIYVALVGSVGYGLYWHATENTGLLTESSRGTRLYLFPLVVGLVLLFFMLKPLLARRRGVDNRLALDPEREPYLFDFVARLARSVGAAPPTRILINAEVNASAGFHHDDRGKLARGRELTIGLPLVAGLSARELAGVLAHEFGHFAQGGGMRLGYTVHRINMWFARVVFGRDEWDEKLTRWSQDGWGALGILGYAARGLVWTVRKLLHGLMWFARMASSYSSRQMEFDADRFEIALAGSKAFCRSTSAFYILDAGRQRGFALVNAGWKERRLAEDMPSLFVECAREFTKGEKKAILAQLQDESTELFATHPRAVERMAAAREIASPGSFDFDHSARVLFDDFGAACQRVTEAIYEDSLGDDYDRSYLLSNGDFRAHRAADRDRHAAMERFFAGAASPYRPLDVPAQAAAPAEDGEAMATELRALRDQLLAAAARYEDELSQYVTSHRARHEAQRVQAWIDAGAKGDGAQARDAVRRANADVERLEAELAAFEQLVEGRLRLCLALVELPELGDALELDDAVTMDALVASARALGAITPNVLRVRSTLSIIEELAEHADDDDKKMTAQVQQQASRVRDDLLAAHEALQDLPYPFEHAREDQTLREHLLPEVPSGGRLEDLCGVADAFCDKAWDLDYQLRKRLAELGEQVEGVLGLEPLPVGATADDDARPGR